MPDGSDVDTNDATFFNDLEVGQKFTSADYRLTDAQIHLFAKEFDPQPFHLDETAASKSLFKGLSASGWHTAAITMRLFVDRMNFTGGAIGLGVDSLKWPIAVRAGDTLSVETEVLELRESRSLEEYGILTFRNVTRNQRGEVVQKFVASALVQKRNG